MSAPIGEIITGLHGIVETSIAEHTDRLKAAIDIDKAPASFLALLYCVPVAMAEVAAARHQLFANASDLDTWRATEFRYAIAESEGMAKAYGEERALVFLTMYDLLRAETETAYRQVYSALNPSAAGVLDDDGRVKIFKVAIGNVVRRQCRGYLPAGPDDAKSPVRDSKALFGYLFEVALACLLAADAWAGQAVKA